MRTYREYLYEICNNMDLNDKEDITDRMRILAKEAMQYHDLAMWHEAKLQEIMSYKDFREYANEKASVLFRQMVEGWADGPIKDFTLEHIDEILGKDCGHVEKDEDGEL